MEEKKDYQVYRHSDSLEPGYKLKVEHSIHCEDTDISPLIALGTDRLSTMRRRSVSDEWVAYKGVTDAAKQWEQQAATTQMINRALTYLCIPEVSHTSNQWKEADGWRDSAEISNRVYKMTCSIWTETKYNSETRQSIPVAWYVTWELRWNSPRTGLNTAIAGQKRKRYTDKAAAMKYLEGRKSAYSYLFTEISPPIPKEHENAFSVYGTLLPGYTVEGQEPIKPERGVLSENGSLAPEKNSVLKKLSDAKAQKKTSDTSKVPAKKKEEMEK